MDIAEAKAWLRGERSHTNLLMQVEGPQTRAETLTQIEQADAASAEHAYWVLRAHRDGLVD